MTKKINNILKSSLVNVNRFSLKQTTNIENFNPKELRSNLGNFTTGVIIACARKNNFFAQKFFSDRFFNDKFYENFLAENNLIKRFEEFWHNFAEQNNWSKKLVKKFFPKHYLNHNKESEQINQSSQDPINQNPSSITNSKIKNFFSENFLQKIKKIFADEFFGMTINSFTSVSLNPPLISFCVDNKSSNLELFKKNRSFILNILSEEQKDLANAFATPKNSKKWTVEPYIFSKFGNPIFHNSLSFIECQKYKVVKMGDHHIIIGEIIDFAKINEKKPLAYFQGKYISTLLS